MQTLNIELLGKFHITCGAKPISFSTRESESTCAFLILNRQRRFDRKRVLSILFPDVEAECAQKRLRNDIWRIKSAFESSGLQPNSYFQVSSRDIGFLPTRKVRIDVEEFEHAVGTYKEGAYSFDLDKLVENIGLYKGDLLEGFDDEWCVWEKERLKMQYLRGLEALTTYFSSEEKWQRAIAFGKQLVLHDPLREHAHRQLMRAYYARGDRPAAIKQYIGCRDRLARELDIEPMRSTQDLYHAIEKETLPRVPMSNSSTAVNSQAQILDEVCKKIKEIKLLANNINEISGELGDQFKS